MFEFIDIGGLISMGTDTVSSLSWFFRFVNILGLIFIAQIFTRIVKSMLAWRFTFYSVFLAAPGAAARLDGKSSLSPGLFKRGTTK